MKKVLAGRITENALMIKILLLAFQAQIIFKCRKLFSAWIPHALPLKRKQVKGNKRKLKRMMMMTLKKLSLIKQLNREKNKKVNQQM